MTRWIAPMLLALLLALLLTACGGDKAKKAEGAGTAQGEVLPGSSGDAGRRADRADCDPQRG